MANVHSIESATTADATIPLNLAFGFQAQISPDANPDDLRRAARDLLAVSAMVIFSPNPEEELTLLPEERASLWATLNSADGLLRAADKIGIARKHGE